jgi:FtsZ-interacting cell division protein YlmF
MEPRERLEEVARRAADCFLNTLSPPPLQPMSEIGSSIIKRAPRSLIDAERIARDLTEGRPVVVNVEQVDPALARRIVDFVSGVTYALDGFYERVADRVFLFTPPRVVISDEGELEAGSRGLYTADEEPI